MSLYSKIRGIIGSMLMLDATASNAINLKNSSGKLLFRNKADTNYAAIGGNTVDIYDSAGTNKSILGFATGAGADRTINLPPTAGSAGQVVQTDGAGNWSYVSAGSTAACQTTDTTSLAFGTTSPLTMFTLPANAVVSDLRVVVDTAFNGTSTVSIGVAGTTSKYSGTGDVDLTTVGEYELSPGLVADGTTNAIIATYSAGGASAGAARLLLTYSVPQ